MVDAAGTATAAPTGAGSEDLLELARLVTVGRLTPGIVHELNNPVFAILGLVELLAADEPQAARMRRLELIRETALEIRATVRTLHETARGRPDGPVPIDLGMLVQEAVALARRTVLGHDQRVVERLEPGCTVRVEPGELSRLLIELLLEAKAAANGGPIQVELARGEGVAELLVAPPPRAAADGPGRVTREAAALVVAAYGGSLTRSCEAPGRGVWLRLPLVDDPEG